MNDEAALLKATRDNPDDDQAKMVLADYWQENGKEEQAIKLRVRTQPEQDHWREAYAEWCGHNGREPYAGFIRRQLEFARVVFDRGQRLQLMNEEDAYFVPESVRQMCQDMISYHYVWQGFGTNLEPDTWFTIQERAPISLDRGGLRLGFYLPELINVQATPDRGFLDNIEMMADHWVRLGDEILQEHPIQHVRLQGRPSVSYLNDADNRRRVYHLTHGPRRQRFTIDTMELARRYEDELREEVLFRSLHLVRITWPKIRFTFHS